MTGNLDVDIVLLRRRVWERAEAEIRWQNLYHKATLIAAGAIIGVAVWAILH